MGRSPKCQAVEEEDSVCRNGGLRGLQFTGANLQYLRIARKEAFPNGGGSYPRRANARNLKKHGILEYWNVGIE